MSESGSSHHCTTACTAGWPAGSKCHCTACGRDFGSIILFDKHRKNNQCIYPLAKPVWRDVYLKDGVFRKRVTTPEEA